MSGSSTVPRASRSIRSGRRSSAGLGGHRDLHVPVGRHADEVVVNNTAQLVYVVNLGCIDSQPARGAQARTWIGPMSCVSISIRCRAFCGGRSSRSRGWRAAVLDDHGLVGWPKTSGSRGVHIWVRIRPAWPFTEVRRARWRSRASRAACASDRDAKWWKEERHGVFLDYNQNARDRTTASAYSVRPTPDAACRCASVGRPVRQRSARLHAAHGAALLAARGDAHAGIDAAVGSIESLLELAARQESEGAADAPWPPHFEKAAGEAPRVAPSRAEASVCRAQGAPPRDKLPVIHDRQGQASRPTRWPASSAGRRGTRPSSPTSRGALLVDTNRGQVISLVPRAHQPCAMFQKRNDSTGATRSRLRLEDRSTPAGSARPTRRRPRLARRACQWCQRHREGRHAGPDGDGDADGNDAADSDPRATMTPTADRKTWNFHWAGVVLKDA